MYLIAFWWVSRHSVLSVLLDRLLPSICNYLPFQTPKQLLTILPFPCSRSSFSKSSPHPLSTSSVAVEGQKILKAGFGGRGWVQIGLSSGGLRDPGEIKLIHSGPQFPFWEEDAWCSAVPKRDMARGKKELLDSLFHYCMWHSSVPAGPFPLSNLSTGIPARLGLPEAWLIIICISKTVMVLCDWLWMKVEEGEWNTNQTQHSES